MRMRSVALRQCGSFTSPAALFPRVFSLNHNNFSFVPHSRLSEVMKLLQKMLLLLLLAFPATLLMKGPVVSAQDATEEEDAVDEDASDDVMAEDEDDEAEVEDDENTELTEEKEEEEDEALVGEMKASPNADTTILFVKGEDFPANNIVKFLLGFTNKGSENFIVDSLDASFRYPQDFQFYIQNFTALQLGTEVPPQRQATFEYSFIPAEPMGGRPFGLVINLNYRDISGNVFQDAVFNQTVTITEREDGLDGETIFLYVFLSGLGLLLVVGLHQLLESRKRRRPAPKVEMGTSNHNDVDMSWIPQETLNQINKASPRRSPRKRTQKRSAGSDE
ncbi:translocon-associated protein subunit alpha isoform X4 [Siphateles boraxobius]|uniref:translocon-associated protein subunit alpha isoform X4 n=1 Tax=Siphateles boraxobius TaxID=180520 RepID=UPI004064AD0A